jgi:hypothetical protein
MYHHQQSDPFPDVSTVTTYHTLTCPIYLYFAYLRLIHVIPSSRSGSDTCHMMDDRTAIGFNVETVTYKNINFQVWDLGGESTTFQGISRSGI